MNFQKLIFVLLAGLLSSQILAAADKSKSAKPNIIVIMADDNDQLSWTIGGNFRKFLYFVGVLGEV
jgi:hypothetical protein